jgi:cysteine desulfurase / selenocysteine lyase
MINVEKICCDFPILKQTVNGSRLAYLDNAATTQKPISVIDAEKTYYEYYNANIHRGVHELSQKATDMYENVRAKVAQFIGSSDAGEIIFTKGTTESINLVAYSWGEDNIGEGDEIVVSILEHHSNLVPWQELCRRKGAVLKFIGINDAYDLDYDSLNDVITDRTRLLAITQMSNALGTVVDLDSVVRAAKRVSAKVLIDGAQGVAHLGFDVKGLDIDFLAFSAHKMLGPTGVGVLYAKRELLEGMRPFLFGGDMIKEVGLQSSKWNDLPYKFEAGTPNIAGVIGFGAALDYLNDIGLDAVRKHDRELVNYAWDELSKVDGVQIFGSKENNGGVVSFIVSDIHAHDTGSILNNEGVAIRTGHHCAQPLMDYLKVPALARMSFYIYNSRDDIDAAVSAIKKVKQIFNV